MPQDPTVPSRPVAPGALLFSAQKDEGPFLLEWIAYHRAIGFEHILIFSNDCSDGSDDLLDRVAETGAVTHIRTTPGPEESAQGHAAKLTAAHPLYQGASWACWLDSDEFLNIRAGDGAVGDLIAAIGDGHGACLSWRLFGDSGSPQWTPGQLATESFVRAAPKGAAANNPVKCFFRTGDWIEGLYIHRPIFTADAPGRGLRFIDNDGADLPGEVLFGKRHSGLPAKDNPNPQRRNLVAQINHYAVRTYDVFQLKRIRGSGMKPIGGDADLRGRRHGQHFWDKRNLNDEGDDSIHRHLPAMKAELARLLAVPAIAAAHQACCAAMSARIQEIMTKPAEPQDHLGQDAQAALAEAARRAGRGPIRRLIRSALPPSTIDYEGIRYHIDPARNFTDFHFWLKGHPKERGSLQLMADLARGKRVCFLDIGANMGLYTLWMAHHAGAGAEVMAFEPNPAMARRLRANIAANPRAQGRVQVMDCAVGDAPGRAVLHIPPSNAGEASLRNLGKAEAEPVEVEVTPLQDHLPDAGDWDEVILKIDVEGYEDVALAGLRTCGPERLPSAVLLEVAHRGHWRSDIVADLTARGYREAEALEGNLLLRRGALNQSPAA